MGGVARICRMYGGMKAVGSDGKTINWVWDYAAETAVTDKEMPRGSARWKAPERRKAKLIAEQDRAETATEG